MTSQADKTESDRLLESSKAEVQRLQQDLQAAVGDKQSMSQSLAEQSAQVQRLTNELGKLSSEKTAAEQRGSELQAENDRLKTQLEQVIIRYIVFLLDLHPPVNGGQLYIVVIKCLCSFCTINLFAAS